MRSVWHTFGAISMFVIVMMLIDVWSGTRPKMLVRSGQRYIEYHDSLFVLRPAQLMEAQATGHQQAHVASPDSAGQQQ